MRKKTHEEFVKELAEVNDNIEVLSQYVNNKTHIKCKCKVCDNEWFSTPGHLLYGRGCPKCAIEKRAMCRRKTHEQFVKELAEVNDKIEIVGKYVNMHTYIECKCKVCGYEWKSKPDNLKNGRGCPKCAGNMKLTKESFIEKLSKVNDVIIVVGDYVNNHTPIDCKCKECGYEWVSVPQSLLQGTGCPKCAGNMKKTHEKFVRQLAECNNSVIVIGEYKNNKTVIECACKNCGFHWFSTPGHLLRGQGCPNCNHSGTSMIEQLLLLLMQFIYGEANVFSRNTLAIGKELDIFIPSQAIAIEYGSWYWHENRVNDDIEKFKLCQHKNIRLITIYDGMNGQIVSNFPGEILYYDYNVGDNNSLLVSMLNDVLQLLEINYCVNDDWINDNKPIAYLKSRKFSTDDFKQRLEEITDDIIVIGDYKDTKTPIKCECRKCGHKWAPIPDSLLRGHGCPKCAGNAKKTHEQFVEELSKVNNNIIILGNYVNSKTHIKCKCRICGNEWFSTPGHLLYGRGCPKCAIENKALLFCKSQEKFVEELYYKHPNINVLGEYINERTSIIFECCKCGYKWEDKPSNILRRKYGCPNCKDN